jgi:RNA polymerase sigma-32 factor
MASHSKQPPGEVADPPEVIEADEILAAEVLPPDDGSAATVPPLPTESGSALPVPANAERGLELADTLTQYMAQLRQHAPISREEEHELAVKWVEDGDVDAARQLVLANLRLVVKIAMEYRRAWVNVLDLIQDGNIGLLEAVQRFDPYRGVKLTSYAVYWIRAYILKHIIDNYRMVRIGRSRAERKLFYRLGKEKRALEAQGFDVEPKLLAERLDVTEADVIQMDQRMSEREQSLNAPVRRDEAGAEFGDLLPIGGASAEDSVADAELRRVFLEQVQEFSASLSDRDREILQQRLLADEPKTLADLGEEFGVSRERIRQLEARLVDQLRAFMAENLVDFEYYASPGND